MQAQSGLNLNRQRTSTDFTTTGDGRDSPFPLRRPSSRNQNHGVHDCHSPSLPLLTNMPHSSRQVNGSHKPNGNDFLQAGDGISNGLSRSSSRSTSNGSQRRLSAPLMPAFMVSAPGKVIVYGEHAVVHGKVGLHVEGVMTHRKIDLLYRRPSPRRYPSAHISSLPFSQSQDGQ
jgi:hypothetical protein